MSFEKPFSDVLRNRHDPSQRHAGLNGHTGRRGCGCGTCRKALQPTLERDHNVPTTGAFKYLDAVDAFGVPTSRLVQPFVLTAFELDGHDVRHSLNSSNAWETVPEALAEHCLAQPLRRQKANRSIVISYTLEAKAEMLPTPSVAAAVHDLKTIVHTIQHHQPKAFAVLPTEPPESVRGEQLKPTLRC